MKTETVRRISLVRTLAHC